MSVMIWAFVSSVRFVRVEERCLDMRIVIIYDDIRRLRGIARMRIRTFVLVFSNRWHDDLCRQRSVFQVLRASVHTI